ncbi:hypothetical protein HLRTI_002320 [Halorhabdus tiamatea SARL4B]|uniref:DUF8165 domain-containing protein n=1 Tax=Halorhabdus tiamatea SARL4B TaxID=1033806 RepID=U2E004_9EURY|nr:hypothetical protein [Halorhabdus tiamatea]ERJ05698.1 hypothetical protein HLRTI_002320 [Halorhabdus tiamatea SARL4B]
MPHTDIEGLPETPSNLYTTHESISYSTAKKILGHEAIDTASTATGAEANYWYTETTDDAVLAVHPESWGGSKLLARMTVEAIQLNAVPEGILEELNESTDIDLDEYSLLVFGRPSATPNHAIQEYLS